jgi:hypothetical protein
MKLDQTDEADQQKHRHSRSGVPQSVRGVQEMPNVAAI